MFSLQKLKTKQNKTGRLSTINQQNADQNIDLTITFDIFSKQTKQNNTESFFTVGVSLRKKN
ncbi:hypothetical protein DERP_004306, partial [Dermatophagoides pteronyssinus]